jgi:hypothetical protein
MKARILSLLLSVYLLLNIFPQTSSGSSMVLREHWYIQSSANLTDKGKVISLPGYAVKDWYPTSVPATVLAALVANKVYPDPYYVITIWNYLAYEDGTNPKATRSNRPGGTASSSIFLSIMRTSMCG